MNKTKSFAANIALNRYLTGLDSPVRIAKSRDIRECCRISPNVLSSWRRNITPIPWPFFDKITSAIGENIFVGIEN